MLSGIQKLFEKTRVFLFNRSTSGRPTIIDGEAQFRNFDAEAAKEEFRRRFIQPFAPVASEDMQGENASPVGAYVKVVPVAVPLLIAVGITSFATPPIMLAISAAIAIRYSVFALPRINQSIAEATDEILENTNPIRNSHMRSIDRWMDKHINQIPEYLDRLDRREEDLRKRDMLLKRLDGNPQTVLLAKEKELLDRYDPQKFRTRAENPFPLKPHEAILGNWHYTKLYNGLRRDIGRSARSRRKSLLKTLAIGRT